MYQVEYTLPAQQDLKSFELQIAKRIIRKIAFFGEQIDPLVFAKRLTGLKNERYRFRIGDYRAIFGIDRSGVIHIIKILRIKHRKDIYNFHRTSQK